MPLRNSIFLVAEWLYHCITASGYALVSYVETLEQMQLDLG